MSQTARPRARTRPRSQPRVGAPVQGAAAVVGVLFVVVGVLGFVPGITADRGSLHAAGHTSHAELLGLFQVSVLHNGVHVLLGVAGLALARTPALARAYLVGGGVLYLVLSLYGLVVEEDSQANVVPLNSADNWLHLVLGLAMIGFGLLLSRRPRNDGVGR